MKKINWSNLLFYITATLFELFAFLGTIPILKEPLGLLTYGGMALTGFIFIKDIKTYTKRDLFVIFALFVFSLTIGVLSGNLVFLKLILFLILAKNIPFRKRIAFDITIRVVLMLTMFVLCQLGIAEDATFWYQDTIRHSLGFVNPNVLGMHMMIICLEFLYLIKDKFRLYKLIPLIIALVVVNSYSASRTSMAISILAIIMFTVWNYYKKIYNNKLIRIILTESIIWTTVIAFAALILYQTGNEYANQLNGLMSGRLSAANQYSSQYGVTLFGNNVTATKVTLDIAPYYVLYTTGLTGLILYVVGFRKLLKQSYIDNRPLAIIIFCFMIYSMSERLWLSADCNMIITALTFVIFDRRGNE